MKRKFKPVSQEHGMGCAVACVGSLCGVPYTEALALFEHPHHAWTRGFYCEEIVAALKHANMSFAFEVYRDSKNQKKLSRPGTIAFLPRSKKYPSGHFLLRTPRGWMNPWSNFPHIDPRKGITSRIEKELAGTPSYIVYEVTS